ncbi:hypothetical protein H2O64_10595 [Kordia sp. YSTF-M3]|uniref:Glycosyltransferase RgtA/B/C/D-like domain-containing protein n=1 Tax=Kordia aestuariivivens TaxID=2759037 RepID=A0ABR7Q9C0_9FLAO|nr:hypothetical protein [Kordia aestuariivivens]MBC8755122.1 hypothetical protein [Kordia aestuariivivens]
MNRKHSIVILLNICIAFGYYLGNLSVNETHLSSDLHNIIPICLKIDDPTLFQQDTFLNDINNVKYYTPFYIETLRFLAKFTDGNYVQALNLLTFICHILFGLLWYFLLFRITKNFWVALFVSLLMRGIVWIPGFEYWGISDLWSMLPRVVYYAVLPLPFLLLNFKNNTKLYLAAFLAGLLFNFHPITGLSGILLFIGFIFWYSYLEEKRWKALFRKQNILSLVFIFIGMVPFFLSYVTNISVKTDYDLTLYKEALALKYPSFITEPTTFWKEWFTFKYGAYFSIVFAFVVLAYLKGTHKDRLRSNYLIGLAALLFILPNLATFIELAVNSMFDLNIRMSFQLVRMQKLLILAIYFAIAFILDILYRNENFKKVFPYIFGGFLLILIFGKHSEFDKFPFVSNDIIRRVLPNSLSVGSIENGQESEDLNEVLIYIRENTPKDAVFFAPDIGRSGGERSVVLDSKGANMLIEGNPKRFVQWYHDYQTFNTLPRLESNQYLRDYGVDYVLIYIDLPEFELLFQKGIWRVYKVTK